MLGCIQPMSSPMMNRIFGLRPEDGPAFCGAVTPACIWACAGSDAGAGPFVGLGGSSEASAFLDASQPRAAAAPIIAIAVEARTERTPQFGGYVELSFPMMARVDSRSHAVLRLTVGLCRPRSPRDEDDEDVVAGPCAGSMGDRSRVRVPRQDSARSGPN